MTSRELTSGFDFWSGAISAFPWLHTPTTFGANSSVEFGITNIFRKSRWRRPRSWIFKLCDFGTCRHVNSVALLSFVPNLVQISVILTEIDAIFVPFLFAVYVDDLAKSCAWTSGIYIVLYADDILLIAPTVCELQKLLMFANKNLVT